MFANIQQGHCERGGGILLHTEKYYEYIIAEVIHVVGRWFQL